MDKVLLRVSWSDSLEASLLEVPGSVRIKLGQSCSKPKISIEKTSQKFKDIIYVLDGKNLLPPPCVDPETGIRKLSYRELVYLDILISLQSFGVCSEYIQAKLFSLFSQDYTKERAEIIYGIEWLEVFISVFCGVEVELIVEKGDIKAFDPVYSSIYATKATTGQLRISLSAIINSLNKRLGLKPIKINRNFGDLPLNSPEVDIVLNTRSLRSASEESIHISRTQANKVLVELSKIEELKSNNTIEDISKKQKEILEDNPFSTIETIQRNGKIVKLKKKTQKLYE